MKHMKRALSLVLAMVMLLGMFVVPTGAVSNFTDEAEITYDEAVEVTSGLGLFAGSDGKFMPKGTVTRAQMATIIVKMLHGSDANADSFKGVNGGFTDTASFEGGWAEGYINWCASLGVVAGYGDGTFRPGQAVTTAEAATMILNALQIDAGAGSWPFTVMSKAEELKFFQDLSPKPDTNKALTREELAVIAFHGLEYSPEGKMGYVYNGVVYDDYMAAYLAANRDASKVDPAKKDSLAADVFGLKSVTGFVTSNQATGLDYTEVKVAINGASTPYKFAIETDQTAIGHYVTVYYDEQYKNEKEPGTTYTIFDETTVVEVTEDIDSRTDFRAAFGSGTVKLSTVEACVVESDYTVKAGYPKATGGFVVNDVTFVTGNTYNVPAGTYILDGNTIVSYIAPAAVYASVVDSVDSYEGEETITLRGVLDPIPNDEGNDMIDEYVAMKVGDYVTYTKVGSRYVLERVRVVSGKVSSQSQTKINGVDYPTVTVDGVDYVKFNGTDATNLNNDVTQLNYTDTYDFYTTRDGKFIGFKTSDGGINMDNIAYLMGVIKTAEKDSYGDQVITYSARGVDMDGVETLVPLALVKDADGDGNYDNGEELVGGKDAQGNLEAYISDPSTFTKGFYTVKDHTDKDARKEDLKMLDGFSGTYNKDTDPVFVVSYGMTQTQAQGMSFGGTGTYRFDNGTTVYIPIQSTTRCLMVEGDANQSTPLQGKAKTGSISVILDASHGYNGGVNNPKALLSKSDGGAYVLEAIVVPVSSLTVSTASQKIYVSKDKLTASSTSADGYVYDVYDAATGKEMQITLKNQVVLTPGFYKVAQDAETKLYEFVLNAGNANGYIPHFSGTNTNIVNANDANDAADGVNNANVLYNTAFDYVYSGKLYAGILANRDVSGAVVVDTRSKQEMDASRISRITSVDRMSSLKMANENLVIKLDIWFNCSNDKVTAIYITDVGDPTADPTRGSILFSNDGENFQVIKGNGGLTGTYEVDETKELSISCSGTCTTHKGFFEIEGGTPGAVNLKHMSADDGAGTLGLHNVVIRTDGTGEWVLADAHGSGTVAPCDDGMTCWNTDSGAEASMYLDFDYAGMQVIDLTNSGITKANLKSTISTRLADADKENELVLSYYCAEGYGDTEPEVVIVTGTNGSAWRYSARTQRVWRLKDGEFAVYSATSTISDAPRHKALTFAVYDSMKNEWIVYEKSNGSGGYFLHHNEVSGAPEADRGRGMYVAKLNEFGRTTLEYQTPVELTTIANDAIIVNSPSEGYTVASVQAMLTAQESKIMGVKVVTNGKKFVFIANVEESLRQVTLNDGDRITIANAFAADDGYVEATVLSTSVPNAPANWHCMVKFDAASALVAGDYQVSVSGGTITLNKLQTRDIADLTAADLAGANTVTFAADVYAGYKNTTWLNAHVSDALLTVKAKETKAGSNVTLEILSASYTVPAGVVLYMANDPGAYYNKGCGDFYVMDNNGVTYLAEGTKQFFTFDKTYFFTNGASTSGEANRVYCYGWKDGYLLSSSSMGLRHTNTSTSYYLKDPVVQDAATAFGVLNANGTTGKFNGCSGYHRVVTGVSNNTMTVANRNGQTSNLNCASHGFIGSCWLSGHSNTNTSLTLSASTVIVDARNGETVSLAEFATMANAATTKLVVNFYTTTKQSTTVDYLVITGLAPLS